MWLIDNFLPAVRLICYKHRFIGRHNKRYRPCRNVHSEREYTDTISDAYPCISGSSGHHVKDDFQLQC